MLQKDVWSELTAEPELFFLNRGEALTHSEQFQHLGHWKRFCGWRSPSVFLGTCVLIGSSSNNCSVLNFSLKLDLILPCSSRESRAFCQTTFIRAICVTQAWQRAGSPREKGPGRYACSFRLGASSAGPSRDVSYSKRLYYHRVRAPEPASLLLGEHRDFTSKM